MCEAHGARFQPIDLRWGIRDEAALDQQTIEICLAEIERCQRTRIKPNFLVLLVERYGGAANLDSDPAEPTSCASEGAIAAVHCRGGGGMDGLS